MLHGLNNRGGGGVGLPWQPQMSQESWPSLLGLGGVVTCYTGRSGAGVMKGPGWGANCTAWLWCSGLFLSVSSIHSPQPCLINIFRPGQSTEQTPSPRFVWLRGLAIAVLILALSDSSLQHESAAQHSDLLSTTSASVSPYISIPNLPEGVLEYVWKNCFMISLTKTDF